MGDRRIWNRRSFVRSKHEKETYNIVSFKFKDKSFARPIVLAGKMAEDWFMGQWKLNGWSEGMEW